MGDACHTKTASCNDNIRNRTAALLFAIFLSRFHSRRPQVKLDPSAFIADPELFLALEKRSNPISCGGGCVLFSQGESPAGLFILKAGEATLTMTSPTGELLMSI